MNTESPSTIPPSISNPDKLLTTPLIEKAIELVRECVALNCLGALSGTNGVGKSTALRLIESRYPTLGLPGRALYLRCCAVQGPTRGVKDILDAVGVRGSLLQNSLSLQMTIKIALRELHSRNIRLLLLDEAENWALESLQGVLGLYDMALLQNQSISILFAATADVAKWLGTCASGLSRTLRCESFSEMSPELMLGVLREWSPRFVTLADHVQLRDKEAQQILRILHKATGGNFRRVNYFARLVALHYPEAEITLDVVQSVLSKILTLP